MAEKERGCKMSESENGKDRSKSCEQNCRGAVVALCECEKSQQYAVSIIKNATAAWEPARTFGLSAAFSAYCIMRSTDRQEILMKDMHQGAIRMERQSKKMIRLTW
jgi:hypothetical protein